MPDFKITLVEKKSPHMLERHPRYDVEVNGRKVDELYFNMTGYAGNLKTVHGVTFAAPERGITTWKKLVAELNKEGRQVIAASLEDPRRFSHAVPTEDGDIVLCHFRFAAKTADLYVRRSHLRAALEILGPDKLSPGFFEDVRQDPVPEFNPEHPIRPNERIALGFFPTEDATRIAVLTGPAPKMLADLIAQGIPNRELPEHIVSSWADMEGTQSHALRVVFMQKDTLDSLLSGHDLGVIGVTALPGHGLSSELSVVFAPRQTSTKQAPVTFLDAAGMNRFGAVFRGQGYRTEMRDVEDTPSPS